MNVRILPVLASIGLINPVAMNAFNPAMPDVVRAFDSDIETVQLSFTLYLATMAIIQLLGGNLADRLGRRPVLLVGLGIHLIGSMVALLAPSVEVLIGGRVLQAVGGGFTLLLVRTIVLDLYSGADAARRLSIITMAVASGQSLSPTIGGYLNHYYGWQSVFLFSLIIASVITVFSIAALPETGSDERVSRSVHKTLHHYRSMLGHRTFLAYTLSSLFAASAYFCFASAMPYVVIDRMGESSATYGNWFLWVSGGFFLGSLAVSRLPRHWELTRPYFSGLVMMMLGALTLLAAFLVLGLDLMWLFIPMALVTFGRGLVQPTAQALAVSHGYESRSLAIGLMGFFQILTGSLVSQLSPVLLGLGSAYILGFILICALLSATAYRLAITLPD